MLQTSASDFIFKFILVGDSSVGKSTLLSRFVKGQFTSDHIPTMGVEFATCRINVGGKTIKLQIWDTAGQETFRTITRAYYKNSIGVILVYDVTKPDSIDSLDHWLCEINQNASEKAQIVVVGNKVDLIGNKLQSEYALTNCPHPSFLTSALTGANVSKVFESTSERILKRIYSGDINPDGRNGVQFGTSHPSNLKLTSQDEPRRGQNPNNKCC